MSVILRELKVFILVMMVYSIIVLLEIPYSYSCAFAQGQDQCDTLLTKAEEQYRSGYWNNAIVLIKQCLNNKDSSENNVEKAYRLLGLVYIATELEKEAKDAIRNLLIMAPDYKINPEQDPPQFQRMIENISLSLIPNIISIDPQIVSVNESGVKVKVTGSNFSYGSKVQFDGSERITEYKNSSELLAELTSGDLQKVGDHYIRVSSPIGGGKLSNSVKFVVNSATSSEGLKIILSGALSVSLGDFANDKYEDGNGLATLGFGVIGDIIVPFGTPGLGWFSSGAFIYNGYNSDALKEKYYELGYGASNDIKAYMIIPVMTGLSYTGHFSTNLSYIINGQIAFSFINGPDITTKLTSSTYSGTAEISYEMSSSFGFCGGAGLIIKDMFILSFRYLNLGKPERNYTIDITLRDNFTGATGTVKNSYKEDQPISMIVISVGVMF